MPIDFRHTKYSLNGKWKIGNSPCETCLPVRIWLTVLSGNS